MEKTPQNSSTTVPLALIKQSSTQLKNGQKRSVPSTWTFSFFILTSTARSRDLVVAAVAHGDASFSREVAQETGEEQGEQRHGGPADAAVRLCAREGLVGTRVLVIAGAVVEEALDAADARAVLHRALRRTHAPPAAHPAGGQRPRAVALQAGAAAAVLALGVYTFIFRSFASRHRRQCPGFVVQGLQLFRTELHAFGLGSDYLVHAGLAAEEPLA